MKVELALHGGSAERIQSKYEGGGQADSIDRRNYMYVQNDEFFTAEGLL